MFTFGDWRDQYACAGETLYADMKGERLPIRSMVIIYHELLKKQERVAITLPLLRKKKEEVKQCFFNFYIFLLVPFRDNNSLVVLLSMGHH